MFRRLPFGLSVAQDLFQEAMDGKVQDLNGTLSIADDIIVFGTDEDDHDCNLHSLMERAKLNGLVLNPDKCFIKVPEVTFFGTVYGPDGAKPDQTRVQEINDLPSPTNKQELQSFLGMLQYLSPLIPNMSDHTAPLRSLLKKDAEFTWSATHQVSFDTLKECVSKASTLHYYNPDFETKIQVDASQKGLGAALIQIDPNAPDKVRVKESNPYRGKICKQ